MLIPISLTLRPDPNCSYGSGTVIGEPLSFNPSKIASVNNGADVLTDAIVIGTRQTCPPLTLNFFARPVAASADGTPFVPTAAEMAGYLVFLEATKYRVATGDWNVAEWHNMRLPVHGRDRVLIYVTLGGQNMRTNLKETMMINLTVETARRDE